MLSEKSENIKEKVHQPFTVTSSNRNQKISQNYRQKLPLPGSPRTALNFEKK